jgi:trimethylamine--corrinoid protein Co-methyltransferase
VRPALTLLDPSLLDTIVGEARELLARTGVEIHNADARAALLEAGATQETARGRVLMPGPLVDRALASAPRSFALFDRDGRQTHDFTGRNVYFTPGSAALLLVDGGTGGSRRPLTDDYVRYAKLVSRLRHLDAQSTAMIPADVPEAISDSYRLYLSLLHGTKPVVTGAFSAGGLGVMLDLLTIVRGSSSALREKPLAMFSCCPTTPLKWGEAAGQNAVDCARAGVPIEVVPMPLAGLTSPVTPVGTLIQHTAEALSGVVLAQAAAPGAPVLFGSSAGILDIRTTTTPLGAIESMMLGCAAAEIGRSLGLPTQAYMILSDAKLLDAQSGLESGMGAVLGALSGINSISGPGMHDFQNGFSLEKLVLDHEACAMARRLVGGIETREDVPIAPLVDELLRDRQLVIAGHTRRHLRDVLGLPGAVIDRESRARWEETGRRSLVDRARQEIDSHLSAYEPSSLPASEELGARMRHEASRHGLETLPGGAAPASRA